MNFLRSLFQKKRRHAHRYLSGCECRRSDGAVEHYLMRIDLLRAAVDFLPLQYAAHSICQLENGYLVIPKNQKSLTLYDPRSSERTSTPEFDFRFYGHAVASQDKTKFFATVFLDQEDGSAAHPGVVVFDSHRLEVIDIFSLRSLPEIGAVYIHDIARLGTGDSFLIGTSPRPCLFRPPGTFSVLSRDFNLGEGAMFSHFLNSDGMKFLASEMDATSTLPTGSITAVDMSAETQASQIQGVAPDAPGTKGFFHPFFDEQLRRPIFTTFDRKETAVFDQRLNKLASLNHEGYLMAGIEPEGDHYFLLGTDGVALLHRAAFESDFNPEKYRDINEKFRAFSRDFSNVQVNHPFAL